jgi:phosphoenolpyruvate carboxykinase (ATP)
MQWHVPSSYFRNPLCSRGDGIRFTSRGCGSSIGLVSFYFHRTMSYIVFPIYFIDKVRSIQYAATGVENHQVFWVPPQLNNNMQPPSGQQQLSDAQFRKLGRMVRAQPAQSFPPLSTLIVLLSLFQMADQIGDSTSIFVQDSAVGSHRLAEVRTRTITNDANVSLLSKHLLVPTVASRVDPVLWPFEITVMIAPELKLSKEELADIGLKSSTFTIFNPERGLALIGGTNASAHIRAAIESLAASRTSNWSVPSVTLPSAHVVAAGANAGLVFDPSGILSHPKNADLVSGFGGAIWNDYGTFRMWGAVSHADTAVPRTLGDLVETSGKTAVVTQSVKNQPIQYSHPAAVVFLVRDSTGVLPGVGRVASNVAGQLLASGYNGTSNVPLFAKNGVAEPQGTTAKSFAGLVEANQTPVFVVNTRRRDGSELTAEEVRAVVNAALDGTLAKSKGVADMTLKMAVISQVPGVKTSLDASKGFKDKAEYAAAAKKLADSLGITSA